jgi:hypothetical protein
MLHEPTERKTEVTSSDVAKDTSEPAPQPKSGVRRHFHDVQDGKCVTVPVRASQEIGAISKEDANRQLFGAMSQAAERRFEQDVNDAHDKAERRRKPKRDRTESMEPEWEKLASRGNLTLADVRALDEDDLEETFQSLDVTIPKRDFSAQDQAQAAAAH